MLEQEPIKKVTLKKAPKQVPSHLAAILALRQKKSEQQQESEQVDKATTALNTPTSDDSAYVDTKYLFKQKNRLEPDSSRSLIAVNWDKYGQLVLKFDDGEKLTTDPVPVNSVSSAVIVQNQSGGGGGGEIGTPDYIQFNTNALVDPVTQGMLTWSKDQETLVLGQNSAQNYLGLDLQVHVRNSTATTIAKGTPVMAVGTLGASGRILVAPMDGTNPNNYKFLIGVAAVDITAGTDGKIVSFGKIRKVNLAAYQDGDVLWISTTQVGKFTNIEPTVGLKMPVAFVIHAANNGVMMTRITPIDENKFLGKSFETVSKNLEGSDCTYSYIAGALTQISYSNGVVKALNYTADVLTSVVLSGSTPAGIELTKTFTYQDDNLVGATYS